MAIAGTLFTYADSFRGFKCRIAAAYGNADLKVVTLNANDKSAHVPNFVSTDKKVTLFTDIAIAHYLSNGAICNATAEQRAAAQQWITYGTTELYSAVASAAFPALSLVEVTAEQQQKACAELHKCLAFLDAHLKTRTWLASERLSFADVSVACDLMLVFQHLADANKRATWPHLTRWWTTVVNQENFKKVTGEIALCTKHAEFNANAFAENKAAAEPKAAKPKAEKPKPQPKAKPAPEPEEEPEETFEDKPSADPFAAMPKGNFNMDEFKRTYSNEDTLTVAMPYLFSKFDKEHYSFWFCEYKYADELTQTFMTCNLIGGMFQRIEKLRKNAFGSMCVWGENNNNTIAGIWFWKGQELVFPLCPDWTTDYASYEWKKLSIDSEEDKKMITQFLNWEGDFKGKKFNSGKIFK